MKRVELTVAYDGTAYCGFQIQKNGITVEEVLNRCLSELTGEETRVVGGSRTDSGVHARMNRAVFDTNVRMPADKFSYALNQRLPEDIRIRGSREVPPDFHPRRCLSRKTYEYVIYNDEFPMPVERLYSYFTYTPLDVEKMRRAAAFLQGEHDFKSFCSARAQVESTVRTIYGIWIEKSGPRIVIRVSGNGFLYNMVRIIAGTLMEIGRGDYPPERMAEILGALDREAAGATAPPQGLSLISYEYLESEFRESEYPEGEMAKRNAKMAKNS